MYNDQIHVGRHHTNKINYKMMKKSKKLKLLLIFTTLFFPLFLFGQCDTDAFLDPCASNLGTYNYIKSFTIIASPRKRANPEYSYVLSKGSTYMLIVCNQNAPGGKMIISLYDRNHNFIGSTYDEDTKKNYTDLIFPCSATGVYYIRASYEGVKGGCGLCILGFTKD
jgi:hypothetical protein